MPLWFKSRTAALVALALISGTVLFLPIAFPISVDTYGKISPAHRWMLLRGQDGQLVANTFNYETGLSEGYGVFNFNRGSSVYFSVENTGVVSDTLTGVRTDAAEGVGLHMSMEQNRMMTMAALRALPVPAKDSVLFRPLGAHVMLTRLTRPLAEGDTVRMTLEFVSGKSIEVRAGVRKP